MPVLLGIVWGALLAVLAGRNFQGMDDRAPRHLWVFIPLFVIQGIARGRIGLEGSVFGLLIWGTAGLAVCAYALWRAEWVGMRLIGAGFASNLVVVILNDYMPVLPPATGDAPSASAIQAGSAGFYRVLSEATSMAFLGDVLALPLFRSTYLLSVGDVLLAVGAAVFVWELTSGGSSSSSSSADAE